MFSKSSANKAAPETASAKQAKSNKETDNDSNKNASQTELTLSSNDKVVTQDQDMIQQSSSSRTSSRIAATKKQPSETDSESEEEDEPIVPSDIEKDAEGENVFTTFHWDGTPPVATGFMAKRFAAVALEEQFRQAEELLQVSDGGKSSIGLKPTNCTPLLVAVPGSFRKVRVVYGASLLEYGKEHKEKDRLVVLHGEYIPGVSYPDALELPTKALKGATIKFPTGSEFGAKRKQAKHASSATWFATSKVKNISYLPFAIPVPPCIIYDAIDKDIDSLIIYERWMAMREEASGQYNTLDRTIRTFLKGLLVLPSARYAQGRLDVSVFISGGSSSDVIEWKRQQMKTLLPALPPSATAATAPSIANASVQEFATAFVSAHQQVASSSQAAAPRASTPAEPDTTATLGLSKTSFNRLLGMCGLSPGEEDHMPKVWTALAEKNLTATDKKIIVRTHVDLYLKYREAKVKLYYPLVQMIIKRDFEEETTTSCLKSAVKGLTPFAVPELTDDEANRINELALALETATSTTIKDVSAATIKLDVPASSEQLTKRLKRFVNLLFVLFGASCPLLRQVDYLIADLEDYTDYARIGMSRRTIASTIWLIHTQSRYFARGYMNEDSGMDDTLPVFDVMSKCIMNRQPVINGDVPPVLYLPPVQPRIQNQDTSDTPRGRERVDRRRRGPPLERDNNRSRIIENPNYHNYIKTKMAVIVGEGRRLPRVTLLCQKAGTRAHELFPGREDLCIKATLYGTCFENCSRKHDMVSDQEAKASMTKLQTVINNPSLVKVNNS